MDIDFSELAAFVALLKEADFSSFRYEKGELSIVVTRGAIDDAVAAPAASPEVRSAPVAPSRPVPASAAPASAATSAVATPISVPVEGTTQVVAPMLGTFYAAPKPGEPAFVQVGDRVEADSVVCIIEVMKLMNSVPAGVAGVVRAVHVGNGDLVEFGQPLFSIEPDAN